MTLELYDGKITLDELVAVRRMSAEQAAAYLSEFDLSPEQIEEIMKVQGRGAAVVADNVQTVVDYHMQVQRQALPRRHWYVTAFLAGAAIRTLAKMDNIQPQTVARAMDKLMPAADRHAARLQDKLSGEAVSEYHRAFLDNQQMMISMTPEAAAQWLINNVELDNDT